MSNKNNNQRCSHPSYYTISDDVYCNQCHEYLGYFDPWKLCGFVKKTKDTISEKYLISENVINKRRRKEKEYTKPKELARNNGPISLPCNPPKPGGQVWK